MFLTVLRSVPAKGSVPAQQLAELWEASQEQSLVEQVRRYLQEERERLSPVLLSPEGLEGWKVGATVSEAAVLGGWK